MGHDISHVIITTINITQKWLSLYLWAESWSNRLEVGLSAVVVDSDHSRLHHSDAHCRCTLDIHGAELHGQRLVSVCYHQYPLLQIHLDIKNTHNSNITHTHTRLTALCPGLPGSAGTRKVKPSWILQDTVSDSGISWDICKSASHSTQITMPAPHQSVFYRPDALPATQPTASKHWRH